MAHTWAAPSDTTLGKVVLVRISAIWKDKRKALFTTGGQLIGGLDEDALNAKFKQAPTAVHILNYAIANGYRIVAMTPETAGNGYTSAYVYLLEKVR